MKNKTFTKIVGFIVIFMAVVAGYKFIIQKPEFVLQPSSTQTTMGIEYKNMNYGFSFHLPNSWNGYMVEHKKWSGDKTSDGEMNRETFEGPLLQIHHPSSVSENTYQDIPIMIFTLEEWDALQKDIFHIGAAPINPSELGRNKKYVFALPARYNYSFPTGFEEVEEIIKSKPLKAFDR